MSNLYTLHARAYIVRICILMVAFLAIGKMETNAQCVTAGTGGCTTLTGTISTTISGYNCVGNITISGSVSIASGADLAIGANKTITVPSGSTLTINSGAELYASGNMWSGIIVNAGGTLIVSGATISDALVGVTADNGITESSLTITGSYFCNNETGIYIGPWAGTSSLSTVIYDNNFSTTSLKAPRLGEMGDYGIYIDQVYPTVASTGVTIGDASIFTGSSTFNTFNQVGIGIRCVESKVKIQDNFFTNIIGVTAADLGSDAAYANTAIVSTSSTGGNGYLRAGNAILGTGFYNNAIQNCQNGVMANDYTDIDAYSNHIYGFTGGSGFTMDNGIIVRDHSTLVNIKNNTLFKFKKEAIYLFNNDQCNADISHNEITTDGDFDGAVAPVGVRLRETTYNGGQIYSVDNNTIAGVRAGIWTQNISRPDINYNIVNFDRPDNNAYGIKVEDGLDALITANQVTAHCTDPSGCEVNAWPLYINGCQNFEADQNQLNTGSAGMYITADCSGSHITCNEMNDNEFYGVLLIANGTDGIGDPDIESAGGDGSDNSWFPSTGATATWANRIRTHAGTDDNGVLWRHRDTDDWFDMPLITIDEPSGTFAPVPTLDNDGNACENPYSMRTDGEDEVLLIQMERKFGEWLTSYMSGAPNYDPYNYYRMDRFWNFVANNDMADLLEGDYEALYEILNISNIPIFKSIASHIAGQDYVAAGELNEALTPVNDIEYYLQQTNEIYLNGLDEDGNFILDDENEPTLRSIAELSPVQYSTGVYNAWGMLDTSIVAEIELEEKLQNPNVQMPWIFPNPAQSLLTVRNNFNIDDPFDVVIYDVMGHKVKEEYNLQSGTTFSVAGLPSGIYTILFSMKKAYLYSDKLMISK